MRKLFKHEAQEGMSATTIWDDVGLNKNASREIEILFGEKSAFETPKPEGLLSRVIQIATNAGDTVLDSFAGSGTTGAVAHKMRRAWIMIEASEHYASLIITRLQKVIDGNDHGGVTESVGWQGGGGFRDYHLASSLIETDRWGNRIISKKYNASMLAEAMCKHLGFTYAPSADPRAYWNHGYSSERDFIYVTTTSLTAPALRGISEDVGPDRTLLICCKAFDAKVYTFENLTIKKIPQAVLANCEWGRDDYSQRISHLPERVEEPDPSEDGAKPKESKAKPSNGTPSLFDRTA